MKNINLKSIINLILRALILVLKFFFSILIIKKLTIEDYGLFGLFQSSVVIGTFIVGFDFYNYASREFLFNKEKGISFYLKNQIILYSYAYLIGIIFFILSYKFINIDAKILKLFILMLISEHLSQELYRILILLKKTLIANIVLFIKSALWVAFLYVMWEFEYIPYNIHSVLWLWFIFTFLSIVFAFFYINFKWRRIKIDYTWIKKGIRVSIPFFIGTILFKLVEFSGRYFLNYYTNLEAVGIYTFFSGITNILLVFVHTVVVIEKYPILLEKKRIGNLSFIKEFISFRKQMVLITLVGMVLCMIFIYPLLFLVDKPELINEIGAFYILLLSTTFLCLSYIYDIALFSRKNDFEILKATIIAFVINTSCNFILVPKFEITGVAISLFITFSAFLAAKYYYVINTISKKS
jgi:O-antigen/teichoic acid export membrane protein